jgi:hypothetical protein
LGEKTWNGVFGAGGQRHPPLPQQHVPPAFEPKCSTTGFKKKQ